MTCIFRLPQVREQYQRTYGKDLMDELKKELSGDFEQVIVALMEPPATFDASHLRYSMKGLGTTESILIDILCTRTVNEIRAIKSAYNMEFGQSLDTDITSDTSGDFEEILVALVQCTRDEGDDVDVNLARNEAKRMLGNKDLKLKPDKETFKMAFANENYRQLETLFDEYQLLSGQTIQKGIEKTFSGDAKAAYLAIVDSIQDAPKYFARRLYESMKGLGTDDMDLIGIIVSRSEIDLAEVSKKFEKTYKRSLVDFIKSECSGEYCETLVKLVNVWVMLDKEMFINMEEISTPTNSQQLTSTKTSNGRPYRASIIVQSDFRPNRTADALEDAMKGLAYDKTKIYEQIIRINNQQRQIVRDVYKTKYGKDLLIELQRVLDVDFRGVIFALLETPLKYDATQLYYAMKGLGTRELTLIDIICTQTDPEKQRLKEAYKEEFKRSLEEDVRDDTSGDFQHLLVSLLQCHRDRNLPVKPRMATEDALLLMGSEKDGITPDIVTFNCAFASQSYEQLQKLFQQYEMFTNESILNCIEKTFSGDARAAYLAVAESVLNLPKYFARRLYESMKIVKGLGTADNDLTYIIVSRSEIDLVDIREEFDRMYDDTLIDWIKSDCSGAYRDALIAIIVGNS
ncbi:unnamed protein product [Anisakis simplex]|uniref:Annexin n=1 Tax=Anisakis simplex TaxID=6269 RepID=A0A158PP01_ANISI|nr:unnamed protein product [Anisakis simplex]